MSLMTADELAEFRADMRAECKTIVIVRSYLLVDDKAGGKRKVTTAGADGYYDNFRTLANVAPVNAQGRIEQNPARRIEHQAGYDVGLPLNADGALMSLATGSNVTLESAGKVLSANDRLRLPDGTDLHIVSIDDKATEPLMLMVHCKDKK